MNLNSEEIGEKKNVNFLSRSICCMKLFTELGWKLGFIMRYEAVSLFDVWASLWWRSVDARVCNHLIAVACRNSVQTLAFHHLWIRVLLMWVVRIGATLQYWRNDVTLTDYFVDYRGWLPRVSCRFSHIVLIQLSDLIGNHSSMISRLHKTTKIHLSMEQLSIW